MSTTPADIRAQRMAYIPADRRNRCQHVRQRDGMAEAWVWTDDAGRLYAVGYVGRQQRPQGPYRFGSEASRRAWVARVIAAGQSRAAAKSTRRQADVRALQVGDVLRAMWGYDQTNIDYYEVTALIGATMVQVRKIASQRAEDLHMQGDCVPAPGRYISEPMRRRAQGDRVTIDSVRSASRITPTVDTAGVRAYAPDRWTAYH